MKIKDIVPQTLEPDTYRVLEIALDFLQRFFGHSEKEAEALMRQFFIDFPDMLDEDLIHHQLSYRFAAIIHFLMHEQGARDELGVWLTSSCHNQALPEAMEYFREHYFDRD